MEIVSDIRVSDSVVPIVVISAQSGFGAACHSRGATPGTSFLSGSSPYNEWPTYVAKMSLCFLLEIETKMETSLSKQAKVRSSGVGRNLEGPWKQCARAYY